MEEQLKIIRKLDSVEKVITPTASFLSNQISALSNSQSQQHLPHSPHSHGSENENIWENKGRPGNERERNEEKGLRSLLTDMEVEKRELTDAGWWWAGQTHKASSKM